MSKRSKPVVFTAKRRKDLAADLGEKDYADIIEMAATKLQRGLHLDLFPARKKFVTIVCSESYTRFDSVHLGDLQYRRPLPYR